MQQYDSFIRWNKILIILYFKLALKRLFMLKPEHSFLRQITTKTHGHFSVTQFHDFYSSVCSEAQSYKDNLFFNKSRPTCYIHSLHFTAPPYFDFSFRIINLKICCNNNSRKSYVTLAVTTLAGTHSSYKKNWIMKTILSPRYTST